LAEDRIGDTKNVDVDEEEDVRILRDRIIECLCDEVLTNNLKTFHGVDMVRLCAKAFLDKKGIDQYQFSGEHPYYKHILERVYSPLVEKGLIKEYGNNNFDVPSNSRLHEICKKELSGKSHIKWADFWKSVE
jgi:hypothetical protein